MILIFWILNKRRTIVKRIMINARMVFAVVEKSCVCWTLTAPTATFAASKSRTTRFTSTQSKQSRRKCWLLSREVKVVVRSRMAVAISSLPMSIWALEKAQSKRALLQVLFFKKMNGNLVFDSQIVVYHISSLILFVVVFVVVFFWRVGSFSADDSLFATGSRFAQTTQLIVFDVATGKQKLNTGLPGLAKHLHSADGFYWIWAMGNLYFFFLFFFFLVAFVFRKKLIVFQQNLSIDWHFMMKWKARNWKKSGKSNQNKK